VAAEPIALLKQRTGDWWQDERRHWCAYCGKAVAKKPENNASPLTRDHVIPRAHKGRHVTIPACKPCNQKKGNAGMPDFLLSDYFSAARQKRRPNQWSLANLWLVLAMAAVEQARTQAELAGDHPSKQPKA